MGSPVAGCLAADRSAAGSPAEDCSVVDSLAAGYSVADCSAELAVAVSSRWIRLGSADPVSGSDCLLFHLRKQKCNFYAAAANELHLGKNDQLVIVFKV